MRILVGVILVMLGSYIPTSTLYLGLVHYVCLGVGGFLIGNVIGRMIVKPSWNHLLNW